MGPSQPAAGYQRPAREARSRRPILGLTLLLCALTLPRGPLAAQEQSEQTKPARFTTTDWILGGTVLGTLALLEPLEGMDRTLSPSPNASTTLRDIGRAPGAWWFTPLTGGVSYLAGVLVDDPHLRSTGLDVFASFATVAVISSSIKTLAGRPRPYSSDDPDALRPFSFGNGHNSFPSGHTAAAFALASTLNQDFAESAPWLPWVTYPLAAWTGVTRVQDRQHWATDVVAGAAVGILSAHLAHRWRHGNRTFEVAPAAVAGGGLALGVTVRH